MMHLIGYYMIIVIIYISGFTSGNTYAETIPSIKIPNYQIQEAYLINYKNTVVGESYKDACLMLENTFWGILPNKSKEEACYSSISTNMIIGATTWYCADGSLSYYNVPHNYCLEFYACPNSSWTISEDKLSCFRPDFSCSINLSNVSEEKLLAAIAYGEASPKDVYEEMAAIAMFFQ